MTETAFPAALRALAFQSVLLLARLGAAAMILPGLGEGDVPAPVRLAIASIVCAVVVYPVPVREREPGATAGCGSSRPLSPLSPANSVVSGNCCCY